MEVPILKRGNYLIATIQSALNDTDFMGFRDTLAVRVGEMGAVGVVVDVSGLDLMDSFAVRILSGLALTIRAKGAEIVIVGIHPEVAYSMVQLGLTMDGVETVLDLEEGLRYLDEKTQRSRGHG